jgi:hypothetical protein
MKKTKTFKKLLEESQRKQVQRSWTELWILGCYQSYLKQTLATNCPSKIKEVKHWWKNCLKTYNSNKLKQN